MAQTITEEIIRALSSEQLTLVGEWARNEEKVRVELHKQETIARIKELARSIDKSVKIEGTRGRPASKKQSHA